MTPYLPPNTDELRFLIRMFWLNHSDQSRRVRADDQAFLDAKARVTQELMRKLVRAGKDPREAENHAMREVALAD